MVRVDLVLKILKSLQTLTTRVIIPIYNNKTDYFFFSGGKNGVGGAYNALQKLLQSGIPGLENLFGQGK